ncbi:hypothetical protein [Micromonospora okii]|uniref:hypothetical protein n=1 Tax=Micromonospora okii TaxID=1182970 RepID=UPI001E3E628D|nr:hypothetical protein [Micromonospora okii]
MSTPRPRCVVLIAHDDAEAARYAPFVDPHRVILTSGATRPAVDGLRVTAVVETVGAWQGAHYHEALAVLRRSLALLPRDAPRAVALISGVPS